MFFSQLHFQCIWLARFSKRDMIIHEPHLLFQLCPRNEAMDRQILSADLSNSSCSSAKLLTGLIWVGQILSVDIIYIR